MQFCHVLIISTNLFFSLCVNAKSKEQPSSSKEENEQQSKMCAFCPPGFTYYAPSSKCYKVIETLNTHTQHEAQCSALVQGGHLAAPLSAYENNFIQSLTQNFPGNESCIGTYRGYNLGYSAYWLGGRRFSADNCATSCSQYTWLWKLGNNQWNDMVYKHFSTGEPNCSGGNDYCMHSESDFTWNDSGCDDTLVCAVCQYDL